MSHLLAAARREFEKLQQPLTISETRGWEMNERDIEITIDEVVLDAPFGPRREAIREAIAERLGRLFAERGAPGGRRPPPPARDVRRAARARSRRRSGEGGGGDLRAAGRAGLGEAAGRRAMSNVAGMSKRTLRGALVVMAAGSSSAQVIVFQYNPANLRRRLAPQMIGGEGQSRSSPMTYTGAPTETIDADVEVDAGDQDAFAAAASGSAGIGPQLAALEVVLYPPTSQVSSAQSMLDYGTLEIGPYVAPTTLFVWGSRRVVPVKITSYSVTEDAFDGELNPIRASIQLSMQVLSYSDVAPTDPSYPLYMAYQAAKEALAAQGSTGRGVDGRRARGQPLDALFEEPTPWSRRTAATPTVGEATFTAPDGHVAVYLQRRLLPDPDKRARQPVAVMRPGERVDLVAARALGSPTQFYRICDASNVADPFDVAESGASEVSLPRPSITTGGGG